MFSHPAVDSVANLFSVPGLELEQSTAGLLIVGVVCYIARIAWIALWQARRIEMESTQAVTPAPEQYQYSGPYCGG